MTARLDQDRSEGIPWVAGGMISDFNADLSTQGNILHDSILSRVGLRQPSWRPNLMTSTLEGPIKFVTSLRSQATCDFSLFGEVVAKVVSIEGSRTVVQNHLLLSVSASQFSKKTIRSAISRIQSPCDSVKKFHNRWSLFEEAM